MNQKPFKLKTKKNAKVIALYALAVIATIFIFLLNMVGNAILHVLFFIEETIKETLRFWNSVVETIKEK